MRISIDISQIVYGTGVSTYTRKLVENLLAIDRQNEYVLFAGTLRRKADILGVFPQTKVFPIPPTLADIVWNRLHILPIEKLIGEVDVLHTSDWTEPPSKAFKVTTVHDLYPLKFPKLIDPKVREVHRRRLSWVFEESRRIIVPSNSTKKDLVEAGAVESKIRIIPEAPTLSGVDKLSIEKAKRKYDLREDYLISIGATKLKNTERIVRAFHLAKAGREVKMVIIGRPDGITLREERNVRILGFVPSEDMASLLSGSRGLVFPSIYEGFGIPILDAFNCGVPVVTSNVASMPEVAGDAAVLVDPTKVDSIAEGIEKILRGPKGYIERGLKRAGEFSWEKTASETLNVYQEASK